MSYARSLQNKFWTGTISCANSSIQTIDVRIFPGKETLCSSQRNLFARIFPDNETHLSYEETYMPEFFRTNYLISVLFWQIVPASKTYFRPSFQVPESMILYQTFCQKLKDFLPISCARSLRLLFMHGLLKNFPDYKNFPCSNATTLQWLLGLCPVSKICINCVITPSPLFFLAITFFVWFPSDEITSPR